MKGDGILEEKTMLNYRLLDWITSIIKDVIEDTVTETLEKMATFVAVNNMLNQLCDNTKNDDIPNLVSETLINKMFDEIKNSI